MELNELKKKSWEDLWNDDLDTFLVELTKREEIEKAEAESAIKKKLGEEKGGRGKKSKGLTVEVLPSKDGIRIEPNIDKAMKEKYEKMNAPKKERVKKEPKEPKKPKVEGQDIQKFMSPVIFLFCMFYVLPFSVRKENKEKGRVGFGCLG